MFCVYVYIYIHGHVTWAIKVQFSWMCPYEKANRREAPHLSYS